MLFRKIKPITGGLDEKSQRTVLFAANELQKYLKRAINGDFPIVPMREFSNYEEQTIFIGVEINELPEVKNKELDDAFSVKVKDFSGIITGDNARSCLLAVYRFLKEIGFYFLRPGENSDIIPNLSEVCDVEVVEAAEHRHRVMCMEGTIFQENLFDLVDWLPKIGMNGYFTQFQIPKVFIERYYKQHYGAEFTNEEIKAFMSLVEDEISKRSMLYHAVGHGWTCNAFGVEGNSWDEYEGEPLSDEQIGMMAQIGGKRGLYKNIPSNTNLCYSNKNVRDKVNDKIVEYCRNHPNITYLHFWLADGDNNNCECENCRKLHVSDHYVRMLNELDEKLTAEKIDTKIVFLLYVDLLWAPLETKFNNPDRFVMMFAPISRSYSKSFATDDRAEKKEYHLNHNELPESVAENLEYFYDWQNFFGGDSFDFDYHLIWDHYYDFSYMGITKVLYDDICNLKKLKLGGMVNCQVPRVFLPTSLGMHICGQTLWNTDVKYEAIVDEVLEKEYGEKYQEVKAYLLRLNKYGCVSAVRGEENITSEKSKETLKYAITVIDDFKAFIHEGIDTSDNPIEKRSWECLMFHGKLYRSMLEYYLVLETPEEKNGYDKVVAIAMQGAEDFHNEFDTNCFIKILNVELRTKLDKSLKMPK